jgi:hypothetical protein
LSPVQPASTTVQPHYALVGTTPLSEFAGLSLRSPQALRRLGWARLHFHLAVSERLDPGRISLVPRGSRTVGVIRCHPCASALSVLSVVIRVIRCHPLLRIFEIPHCRSPKVPQATRGGQGSSAHLILAPGNRGEGRVGVTATPGASAGPRPGALPWTPLPGRTQRSLASCAWPKWPSARRREVQRHAP